MTNLSDKILGTIEEKKIEPIAKWKFLLTNFLLWTATLLFFLVGIFVAAIFFLLADQIELWDFLIEKPALVLSLGIIGIFFFWGGMSILFSLLSKFFLQNTKKGYKYPLSLILFAIFLLQIFSGFALAHSEVIKKNILPPPNHLPFYDQLHEERQKIWMHPENGFLAGKIEKVSDNNLLISDRKQNIWNIFLTPTTKYPPNIAIQVGEKIRIQGKKQEGNNFTAAIIFPFEGNRRDMRKNMNTIHKMMRDHPEIREKIHQELMETRKKRVETTEGEERRRGEKPTTKR